MSIGTILSLRDTGIRVILANRWFRLANDKPRKGERSPLLDAWAEAASKFSTGHHRNDGPRARGFPGTLRLGAPAGIRAEQAAIGGCRAGVATVLCLVIHEHPLRFTLPIAGGLQLSLRRQSFAAPQSIYLGSFDQEVFG
jgi:hypothetical protein